MASLTTSDLDINPDLDDIRAIAAPVKRDAKNVPKKKVGVTPKRKRSRLPKPDPRGFRWQVRVWLDANKPDQLDLGKWIHELKCKRTFAPILRNALSLYRELIAGEVGMLYQLFPDIKPTPPIIAPDKIAEMQKKIDELQDRVNSLTDIVIKQQSPGAVDMSVKMLTANSGAPKPLTNNTGGPKPLQVKSIAAPVYDDDDDDLITTRKDESSGRQSQINFMKSAYALNGMVFDESSVQ